MFTITYFIKFCSIIAISLVLLSCAEMQSVYDELSEKAQNTYSKISEKKPPARMTLSELENSEQRVKYLGQMISIKGKYKGFKEYATSENALLNDAIVTICDAKICSNKFYVIWAYRRKFQNFNQGDHIEVTGYLGSLSSGNQVIGDTNAALVARSKSTLNYLKITEVNKPTANYSKGKQAPREIIRMVQSTLNTLGYDAGNIDGIWGEKTSNALQGYQLEHDLHYSGKLDENTLKAIVKENEKLKLQ